jgi:hypothetical protein
MPSNPYVASTLADFSAITESLPMQGFPLFPIKSILKPLLQGNGVQGG